MHVTGVLQIVCGDGRLGRPAEQSEAYRHPQFCLARAICYPALAMDYLWTPWRYAYVTSTEKTSSCIFCDAVKAGDDARALIVYRAEHCFVILNAYPYTPGHVMIVP
ncbi:MAG: hypothetical protein WB683_05125, partial [Candidatus Sulfotelmatobacter sp.]